MEKNVEKNRRKKTNETKKKKQERKNVLSLRGTIRRNARPDTTTIRKGIMTRSFPEANEAATG